MLKRILATTATAVVLLGGFAVPADAAPTAAVATCHAHKVAHKSYWTCVTPGAYCAASAHNKVGYAKPSVKHRKYKCLRYSNGRWRWKRA